MVRQLVHFFALLWGAAVLAVLAVMPQLGIAIAVIVVVNAGFAFAQEYRADRAAQRLEELLPVRATVLRDGRRQILPAAELVRGDVVLLAAGDRISADLRLGHVDGLSVDESTLTGESVPSAGRRVDGQRGHLRGAGRGRRRRRRHRRRHPARRRRGYDPADAPPTEPLAVRLGQVVRVIAVIAWPSAPCSSVSRSGWG